MTDYQFVDGSPGLGCKFCGAEKETRLGACWDCASRGEERAAKRTVSQHLLKAIENIRNGSPDWRFDIQWAKERLTRTGDYAKGGTFDCEGYDWRGEGEK